MAAALNVTELPLGPTDTVPPLAGCVTAVTFFVSPASGVIKSLASTSRAKPWLSSGTVNVSSTPVGGSFCGCTWTVIVAVDVSFCWFLTV